MHKELFLCLVRKHIGCIAFDIKKTQIVLMTAKPRHVGRPGHGNLKSSEEDTGHLGTGTSSQQMLLWLSMCTQGWMLLFIFFFFFVKAKKGHLLHCL
jgi:hypothetical protein